MYVCVNKNDCKRIKEIKSLKARNIFLAIFGLLTIILFSFDKIRLEEKLEVKTNQLLLCKKTNEIDSAIINIMDGQLKRCPTIEWIKSLQ